MAWWVGSDNLMHGPAILAAMECRGRGLDTSLERQSLRSILKLAERDLPDEIPRIREPVRTHLDITSSPSHSNAL